MFFGMVSKLSLDKTRLELRFKIYDLYRKYNIFFK